MISMHNLMFWGTLLCPKSKSYRWNSIRVVWVGSSEIFVTFCYIEVFVWFWYKLSLHRAQNFIVVTLSDLVVCLFHELMHSNIQVNVLQINLLSLSMEYLVLRLIIHFIRPCLQTSWRHGQMSLGTLIEVELDVVILPQLHRIRTGYNILLPQLIRLHSVHFVCFDGSHAHVSSWWYLVGIGLFSFLHIIRFGML